MQQFAVWAGWGGVSCVLSPMQWPCKVAALKPKVAGRCGDCLLWMTTAILWASSPEAMSLRQPWKRAGQQQAPTERNRSMHDKGSGSNSRSASLLRQHLS